MENVSVKEDLLGKLVADVEFIKMLLLSQQQLINGEGELEDSVKQQIQDARDRIALGKFVSNEEILKEFEVE
ncbi:hypothetical protein ACFL0X_02665 [Nanoarchaeota archaeon]